ncbi:MAG: hypothetical protein IKE05_01720 [Clostridia bacterium]|nr:hypothetical protein [Clostridia bacterium]
MLRMKTFSKSLGFSVEKLEDAYLENVAGGSARAEDVQKQVDAVMDDMREYIDLALNNMEALDIPQSEDLIDLEDQLRAFRRAQTSFVVLTAVGAAGAVGCSIASAICKAVSVHARDQGNMVTASRCSKAAIGLGACVAPFVVAGAVGGVGIVASRCRG